ncbi:hypothetical protein MNBD_PLANCTO02-3322 [hydrothermal vent metagenome]|uniref:histidine kinase n=1 Tax=hydrothermal vent metagenome TaxID=652676 RepID=A0A3B1DRT7_9ZZZZ
MATLMRWSLRYQILLPMVAVMLVTLVGVSTLNAYLSAQRAKAQIHNQLRDVAKTLSRATFPLTDVVLKQIHGLSGAEYIVTKQSGEVVASSQTGLTPPPLSQSPQSEDHLVLGKIVQMNQERYFHAAVTLPHQPDTNRSKLLHIFYPEESYRVTVWNAVLSPLLVGGVALLLVVVLSVFVSSRVTRPLGKLKTQVEQIAEGEFQPMSLPLRNDEILDLGVSVNRMAEMLSDYEEEVRRNERLRTLGQLSGSMAHQLRNAVTGCRMALDLHVRKCDVKNETIDVALRQLVLMERYLKQFFSRGDGTIKPHTPINLVAVVEEVLALVRPNAEHVGVQLQFTPPENPLLINGDSDGLEQLVINLLQNGIEAAAVPHENESDIQNVGSVTIQTELVTGNYVLLEIQDSGCGPEEELSASMFEPLVTGRVDGTGLGLSVAQEIAKQHQGKIRWERRNDMTHFIVEFPTINGEKKL